MNFPCGDGAHQPYRKWLDPQASCLGKPHASHLKGRISADLPWRERGLVPLTSRWKTMIWPMDRHPREIHGK